MTRSVKVGDKVKSRFYGNGVIEDDGHNLVGVRFDSGSYRAYRKDDWSSTLEDDSIEFIQPIKVGDTVTLIDNFYNHEKFKSEPRIRRKSIASLRGKSFDVSYINKSSRVSGTCKIAWSIPIDLLRKVDDGINAEWIATGVVDDGVVKGMDKPKKGDPVTSFKPGKKYVYSKELSERGTGVSYQWHDMCDGKEVDVANKSRGSIGSFVILPQWCYEIPTLHRHTPEQVAEAQRIIGEIVAGFKFGQCFDISDESDRELTIRYTSDPIDRLHTITAHCSPHDEFNRTIGVLVALCKATGRKLPDWI